MHALLSCTLKMFSYWKHAAKHLLAVRSTPAEGQHRCVGSPASSARLSGRSSAAIRHGVTIRIGYFCVSDVRQSGNRPAPGMHQSCTMTALPHLPPIYTSFFFSPLPPNHFSPHFSPATRSLRDGESLAGNECRGCVISASVCRAN